MSDKDLELVRVLVGAAYGFDSNHAALIDRLEASLAHGEEAAAVLRLQNDEHLVVRQGQATRLRWAAWLSADVKRLEADSKRKAGE